MNDNLKKREARMAQMSVKMRGGGAGAMNMSKQASLSPKKPGSEMTLQSN
jgi:hypothetical protein